MNDGIWCEDCRSGLWRIPLGSADLVLMDPPYALETQGGGAFGNANRAYHDQIAGMSEGLDNGLLEMILARQPAVNAYIWCNKAQLRQYLDFFGDRKCNTDLLTWHKSNPAPTCNNKYLSDTEYVIFARDPGVKLYGSYETKRKHWETPVNKADKVRYGHPTVKPLEITMTLISNSTLPGQTVLDPFLGSGTTAEACVRTGRRFIGFEVRKDYYDVSVARLKAAGWLGGGEYRVFFAFTVNHISKRFMQASARSAVACSNLPIRCQ